MFAERIEEAAKEKGGSSMEGFSINEIDPYTYYSAS